VKIKKTRCLQGNAFSELKKTFLLLQSSSAQFTECTLQIKARVGCPWKASQSITLSITDNVL